MVQDLSLVWPSCMLIIFFYLICFVGFYLIESVGYEFFILIWSFFIPVETVKRLGLHWLDVIFFILIRSLLYSLKLWKGSVWIGWMWVFYLIGITALHLGTWSQAHSIILKEKYFQEEKCDQQQDHKMITSPLNYFKTKVENFQEEKCENILSMIRYGIDGQYMANLVSWWRSQPSHCIDFKTFIKNFLGQVQEKIVFFPQLFCLFTVKHTVVDCSVK